MESAVRQPNKTKEKGHNHYLKRRWVVLPEEIPGAIGFPESPLLKDKEA